MGHAAWDAPVGSGTATHPGWGGACTNSCPQHWNRKKRKKKKNSPQALRPLVVFQLNEIIFPPSGNPVWVRGPAFSLLLIVCSEEEVKHTIRPRWLSLPANVLIPACGRSVPFLFLCDKCSLIWSLCAPDLYLFDQLSSSWRGGGAYLFRVRVSR